MNTKLSLSGFINESLQIIRESDDKGNPKPLKIRGIFGKMDEENGNGRIYPRKLWEKLLADPELKTKLEKRRMLGELRHPEYRDIDPERSAFVVTKLWAEGSYVMGEAEVLPPPTPGAVLEALLKVNIVPGVSSRGEGSVIESGGKTYVNSDDYDLITFDMTMDPSVSEAFPAAVVENKIRREFKSLIESQTKLSESCYNLMSRLLTPTKMSESARGRKKNTNKNLLVTELTQGKKMSTDSTQMKSVVTRLDASLRALSEQRTTNAEKDRTIKNLKTKIAEMRGQQVTLASKSQELLEAYKRERKTSTRAVSVIAEMRNRYKSHKSHAHNITATTKSLSEKKLQVVHARYAELVESLVKNYRKSLRVIEQLVKEYQSLKETHNKTIRNYNRALSTLDNVGSRVNESKIETYLRRELRDLGGFEKFSSLIGDVKTLGEARKKVKDIRNLVEGRDKSSNRANMSAPLARVDKLRERNGRSMNESHNRTTRNGEDNSMSNIINLIN